MNGWATQQTSDVVKSHYLHVSPRNIKRASHESRRNAKPVHLNTVSQVHDEL